MLRSKECTEKEADRMAAMRHGSGSDILEHFTTDKRVTLSGRLRNAWRCLFTKEQCDIDFVGLIEHLLGLISEEVRSGLDHMRDSDDLHQWLGENLNPMTSYSRVIYFLEQIDRGWRESGAEYPWNKEWKETGDMPVFARNLCAHNPKE